MCPLLHTAWSLHTAALAAPAASPPEDSDFSDLHELLPLRHDRGSARALGRGCKAVGSELLWPTRSSSARVAGLLRLATFNDRLHCCEWREQRGYAVPAPSAPSPGLSRTAPRDQVPGHAASSAGHVARAGWHRRVECHAGLWAGPHHHDGPCLHFCRLQLCLNRLFVPFRFVVTFSSNVVVL